MEGEYIVEPVDYQDVLGLADTLVRAMYKDDHFVLSFNKVSLQEIIDDTAKRMPSKLSSQRERNRHEKVIHRKTGTIVGYARWVLPRHLAGDTAWTEAQTRQPTEEEKEIFQQDLASTEENGRRRNSNHEMTNPLGRELGEQFNELTKDACYLGISLILRRCVS
jgi:hypothetical protein